MSHNHMSNVDMTYTRTDLYAVRTGNIISASYHLGIGHCPPLAPNVCSLPYGCVSGCVHGPQLAHISLTPCIPSLRMSPQCLSFSQRHFVEQRVAVELSDTAFGTSPSLGPANAMAVPASWSERRRQEDNTTEVQTPHVKECRCHRCPYGRGITRADDSHRFQEVRETVRDSASSPSPPYSPDGPVLRSTSSSPTPSRFNSLAPYAGHRPTPTSPPPQLSAIFSPRVSPSSPSIASSSSGSRTFGCPMPECSNMRYTSYEEIYIHVVNAHKMCTNCNQRFSTVEEAWDHKYRMQH
ncbi:hypothetical protein BXZ70DRAFT_9743 [Cristinia sonorae]|uniref:C2H2-type domain-containing protein n=1 Tax=Cristinia sonorae TaxID=1940300 RepID=A0A8K0UYA4_9AGAR|nr:hypothetical protein BXZ70DRAFT_9743 [Cristinia sonorae]